MTFFQVYTPGLHDRLDEDMAAANTLSSLANIIMSPSPYDDFTISTKPRDWQLFGPRSLAREALDEAKDTQIIEANLKDLYKLKEEMAMNTKQSSDEALVRYLQALRAGNN